MSNPYVGEIRMFAGNFAPVGWEFCNGQLMNIADYDILFNLIGTTYGGDGQETFALPNLASRIPLHFGSGFAQGQMSGTETVTLTPSQLPAHTHPAQASATSGTLSSPAGAVWANSTLQNYSDGSGKTPVPMSAQALLTTGGNQAHDNMMPSLALSFIISMYGIYPSPA